MLSIDLFDVIVTPLGYVNVDPQPQALVKDKSDALPQVCE
jgi:hypothetical protein